MANIKNNSKIIFHIDMNAFFCSVACIINPKLRGKVFAIGRENTTKGVLSTASYEARALGVHAAMPVKEAYELVPDLIVVDLDYNIIHKYHVCFVNLVKEYTQIIEVASVDEVYADMTLASETKHPLVLAKEIQVRLLKEYNLPCSIGIAPTLFLAKMASDIKKPLGVTVLRKREVDKILYPLSVKEIFGIGKKTYPKLIDNGIKTIGEFMDINNKDKVISLIGDNSYNYAYNSIIGNSSNIVDPERYSDSRSISNCVTYDVPLHDLDDILLEIRKITRNVVNKMNKHKYFTKTINITLRDTTFKTITRAKTIDDYIDTFYDIYEIVVDLIEENYMDKEYRLIGMGVSNLLYENELPKEYNLFTLSSYEEKYDNIVSLMNNFQTKYGKNILYFNKSKKNKLK